MMGFAIKKLDLMIAGVIAVMTGSAVSGLACSSYTRAFNDVYGTAGSPLDSCMVCHPAGEFGLNPYGKDFKAAGVSFRAIEARDSDGDGAPNAHEITAGTFPGDRQSSPSTDAGGTEPEAVSARELADVD